MLTAARLSAVPLLVLVLLFAFLRQRGPFWLGTNSDPSYVYLLSACGLAEGVAPAHLDHPGLTVHLFGAVTVRAVHALSSSGQPLADDVLARPEWYLGIAVRVLLVLFAASLVVLGHAVHRLTSRWALAWTAQLGVLLSPSAPFELTDFKPEPLLYLFGTLLAAVLAHASAAEHLRRFAPLLGILAGLAVATKLTALPFLVAAIIVLDSGRTRLVCLACAVLTATVCALPALPHWGRAVSFVATLAGGRGLYGVAAFAAERPYASQWLRIVIEEAPFLVALLFAGVVLAYTRGRPSPSRGARVVPALLLTGLAQLALTATHPYQPRYLVPALSLVGLLLAVCGELSDAIAHPPGRLATLVLAVVLVSLGGNQVLRLGRRATQIVIASACQQRARAEAVSSGCRIASYYRASSPALALFQADGYSRRRFRERLARLWPDEAFLVPPDGAMDFSGTVDLASLTRDRCLVVQGAPGGPLHPFARVEKPFAGWPLLSSARPLFQCEWETVVRVDAPPAEPASAPR